MYKIMQSHTHAGSRNRVEYAEKEPATGKRTAISPSAWTVQYNIIPIRLKAMSSDAGPPFDNALPDPTNRPVPVPSGQQEYSYLKSLVQGRTDGPSDCYHLQMSSLEFPCQRRFCRIRCSRFHVKDLSICADCAFRCCVGLRIALEAVHHPIHEAVPVAVVAVVGAISRWS
jgi:hypothetical protein